MKTPQQQEKNTQSPQNTISEVGTAGKMPPAVQAKMENAFGTDFSDVSITPNSQKASSLGALAYTQGNSIQFAQGQYDPNTEKGQSLLGHELTHVVQQKQGRVQPTDQIGDTPINDNASLEAEADLMGSKAAKGESVQLKKSLGSSNNNKTVQRAGDGELQKHVAKNVAPLQQIPEGTIPSPTLFDKATYEGFFTGEGTAKKQIKSILEKIYGNKSLKSMVHGESHKSTSSIALCTDYETIRQMHEYASVMIANTGAWLQERGNDPDRAKREKGFLAFLSVMTDFKMAAENRMRSGGISEEQISGLEENFSQESKDTISKIQLHYANRSAGSVFTNLAKPLKMLAPVPDSKGSVEVEVKIPIPQVPGLYIGGTFGLEAEHGEKAFKIGCNAALKVGIEYSISNAAKLGAGISLGAYIESQAATPEDALRLVSYGLYKRLKENSIIGRYADGAWGGKTSADKFVARTEADIFDNPNAGTEDDAPYVEMGGSIGANAEAKTNFGMGSESVLKGGLEAQAGYKSGTRYDKDTTAGRKGKNVSSIDTKIAASFDIAGFGAGIEYTYGKTTSKDPNVIAEAETETNHIVTISASSRPIVGQGMLITKLVEFIAGLQSKGASVVGRGDSQRAKATWGAASSSLTGTVESLADGGSEDFVGDLESGVKSEGKLGLSLELNLSKKEGTFTVSSDSETEIAIEVMGGVNVKVSKSKSLVVVKYANGWSLKVGGFNLIGGGQA